MQYIAAIIKGYYLYLSEVMTFIDMHESLCLRYILIWLTQYTAALIKGYYSFLKEKMTFIALHESLGPRYN
jgi:hypothetical protein